MPEAYAAGLAQIIEQEIVNSSKERFMGLRDNASEKYDVRIISQSILNLYDRTTVENI